MTFEIVAIATIIRFESGWFCPGFRKQDSIDEIPTHIRKGGSVEETRVYKFSPHSKFEFSYQRTE